LSDCETDWVRGNYPDSGLTLVGWVTGALHNFGRAAKLFA